MQVRDIDYDHLETLYEVLGRILVKPEVSDSHNKNNAGYSILFEAISLIISFGNDAPEYLRDQGTSPTLLYYIPPLVPHSAMNLLCPVVSISMLLCSSHTPSFVVAYFISLTYLTLPQLTLPPAHYL
jgi:hypothetical protein